MLLRQAQLQEAESPSCVPPTLVHGVRDGTEGSSCLLKRVAGSGVQGKWMEPVTGWGPLGNEAASEVGCGFYSRL